MPTAGSTNGNQAIATFMNAVGETVQVTSNLAETTINQVAGLELTADASNSGAPGGKVFFPHTITITNTANGLDVYDLSTATVAVDFTAANILIYADANTDGIPDSLTPITVAPLIMSGRVFGIVVEATIPTSAAATNTGSLTVTATSQLTNTIMATNNDTITVTSALIIDLTKSMSPGTVLPGDTVTVTLRYQNNGLAAATNVNITNLTLSGLTYVPGSTHWSNVVGTVLTDATGNTDATNSVGTTMTFDFGVTITKQVTAVIDSMPAGRRVTITFNATVNTGMSGSIPNMAEFTVNNNPDGMSNQATIIVTNAFAVTIADSSADLDSSLNGVTESATNTDGNTTNDTVAGFSMTPGVLTVPKSDTPAEFISVAIALALGSRQSIIN